MVAARLMGLVLSVMVLARVAPAAGQPAAAPQLAAPAPRPSEETARQANSPADRVILIPTAYRHPKGTVYLSSYDVFVLQVGYALTDRVQVSLLTTPPIEGAIVPLDLTVKTSLFRESRVRVAALGSASGVGGLDDVGFLFIGRAGATVQLCIDAGSCQRSFTLASNVGFLGPVLIMWNGIGAIWPLRSWLSLLVEVDTLIPVGTEGGSWNGMIVSAGLRFPGSR